MQPISGAEPALHEFGTKVEGIDYIARPGVYAVIENIHNQIAVIETSTGYFLPGGGVEPGETDMDALIRELREETGYQISVLAKIGEAVEYINAHTDGIDYQIHGKFYKVEIDSIIGKGIEEDHRIVWLSRAEASKVLKRQSQAWAIHRIVKNSGENAVKPG